jgi:hypothetical protein
MTWSVLGAADKNYRLRLPLRLLKEWLFTDARQRTSQTARFLATRVACRRRRRGGVLADGPSPSAAAGTQTQPRAHAS